MVVFVCRYDRIGYFDDDDDGDDGESVVGGVNYSFVVLL